MNYGPWDRMYKNEPIIPDAGKKPAGANFYPADITKDEFDSAAAKDPAMKSPSTMIRRSNEGRLFAIPYHEFFHEHVQQAADKLLEAAKLTESPDFKKFLELRAIALLTDAMNWRPFCTTSPRKFPANRNLQTGTVNQHQTRSNCWENRPSTICSCRQCG